MQRFYYYVRNINSMWVSKLKRKTKKMMYRNVKKIYKYKNKREVQEDYCQG